MSSVAHADVQAWVTKLAETQSPASVRKIHRVLSLILDMAVQDGRLARNVAAKVNLPGPSGPSSATSRTARSRTSPTTGYPTDASKHSSLDTRTNEMYRLVVLFLAYTGVRFGEMAALKAKRLDLLRGRAVIAESVTPVQGHGMVWGPPKSHHRREVAIPGFLVDDLAAHVAGKEPEDLVSAASATASRFASRRSAPPSAPRRPPSASRTYTPMSCATPLPASPSRAVPT